MLMVLFFLKNTFASTILNRGPEVLDGGKNLCRARHHVLSFYSVLEL